MSLPEVSVIVPVHNRAATLARAVGSVLDQSFTALEVIIVDDASTDGSRHAAEALGDGRVTVLAHAENRGAGAARNTGITAARAPWVAFQDSDDLWKPEKLVRQMALLARAPADVVGCFCRMAVVTDLAGPGGPARAVPPEGEDAFGDKLLARLMRDNPVSTQTLVARTEVLRRIGGFDETLPALEDWDLALRLAQEGGLVFEPEALVEQHFSPNSLTRSRPRRAAARRMILDKHRAFFARDPAVEAHHLRALAGEARRMGEHAQALRDLAAARRLRPADPRLLALTGLVGLARLLRGGGR